MDTETIMAFAQQRAGNLEVELAVELASGDGFSITRTAGGWSIRGNNARSCLWGVLQLRNNAEEGEFIPRFNIRGLNVCETWARHTAEMVEAYIDRMAEMRMNTLFVHTQYGYQFHKDRIERLCDQRGIEITYYVHTSRALLTGAPIDILAKNTGRKHDVNLIDAETRLCASNPDALAFYQKGIREYFESDAVHQGASLLLIDADGYRFCKCEKCRELSPVEQWQKLFSIAVEQAAACSKEIHISYLSYVWRYQLPKDMTPFRQVSGVMFDTHQRFRWKAIGEDHAISHFNGLESKADSRAASIPLNQYLRDRLVDWRGNYEGNLFIFENLQLHGSISCPQPYTPQLLRDLDLYEELNLDGIIYEAFEPGIKSFTDQLAVLSRSLWSDRKPHAPTELEIACEKLGEDDAVEFDFRNCFNVLAYLTTSKFDGIGLLERHLDDQVLLEYAKRLKTFLENQNWENCRRVLKYVFNHKDRFDYEFIAYNLMRAVSIGNIPNATDPLLRRMLTTDVIFDLMDEFDDPMDRVDKAFETVL